MKKFEQTLKQKAHLIKIKNARTTIIASGRHTGKPMPNRATEQAKLLLSLYQNKSYDAIPAYKLLRTVGLQQYTRGFIVRGYGINLGLLALIDDKEKEKLYEDLKILPGHTVKLDELIKMLAKNSYSESYDQDNYSQKSISQLSKKSLNVQQFPQSQYDQQLQRLLDEYTPQNNNQPTSNFKINQTKPSVTSSSTTQERSKVKVITSSNSIRRSIQAKPKPKTSEKIHHTTKQTSLTKEKSNINLNQKEIMNIDLQIEKIKDQSRSFDGALMSSTIVNIDLEELIFSFAGFIFSKIAAVPVVNKKSNYNIMNEKQNNNEQQIEDEVGQILRESYMHPLYRNEVEEEIQGDLDGEQVLSEGNNDEEELPTQQVSTSMVIGQSSFLGGQSHNFGISSPLKIFDEPNPVQIDYLKPTIDSVFNFVKNVVLASKMQRQIPIMAASYVETFLSLSNLQLTTINYKRVLVSSLLLASKIWDDESFESPSFSKTFPEYTTVLLNEMEKQILRFLDYRLKLDKKQYAKIYFILRKYRKNNYKSYQNRRLPLNRIRELQRGSKKQYKSHFMLQKRPSF